MLVKYYDEGLNKILNNHQANMDTPPVFKLLLVREFYVFSQSETQATSGQIGTNELTSVNYTAGGKVIQNVTVTYDGVTEQRWKYDGDDVEWTNLTATARGAVLYISQDDDSDDPPLCYFDFEGDQVLTDDDIKITFHATDGFIKMGKDQ